ncbi:uncharacterized protein [Neodiprion pinetum]|uniref:uncharacterized protein n=1 Tax=Neodiprion pinetum TaxID=441929 RepID=UPI001EE01918|nr:uncharacterized protein LOC124223706 [Neodiprion pinetum]
MNILKPKQNQNKPEDDAQDLTSPSAQHDDPLRQHTLARDTAIGQEDSKLSVLHTLITETISLIKAKRTVPTEVTKNIGEALGLLSDALVNRKAWKDAQRRLTYAENEERKALHGKLKEREETLLANHPEVTPRSARSKRPANSPPAGPEEDVSRHQHGNFALVTRRQKKQRTNAPRDAPTAQQMTTAAGEAQTMPAEHPRAKNKNPSARSRHSNAVLIKPAEETGDGGILLELDRNSEHSKSFTEAVTTAVGASGAVKDLTPAITIEIRDIDSVSSEDDIRGALTRDLRENADIKRIGLSKNIIRGQRMAFVELSDHMAQKILSTNRIKIGWIACRVRIHEAVQRCFKCLGYEHVSRNCSRPDRSNLCYKCGEASHKAASCNGTPNESTKRVDSPEPDAPTHHRERVCVLAEQHSDTPTPYWIPDNTGTAAIWIVNPDLQVVGTGKGDGFAWAKLQGYTIFSCHLSPNEDIHTFRRKLGEIEDTARQIGGEVVIAGDLNAKSTEWGMDRSDTRGNEVSDMTARLDLVIVNEGNTTTWRRPELESSGRLQRERPPVHPIWNLQCQANQGRHRTPAKGMDEKKLDEAKLMEFLQEKQRTAEALTKDHNLDAETLVEKTMSLITVACSTSMPARPRRGNRRPNYWWNSEIRELRAKCLALRRKFVRANRGRQPGQPNALADEFDIAKKDLKKAIKSSKR